MAASLGTLYFLLHLLVGLLLIAGIALGAVLLRLGEELFGDLREGADQAGEAVLAHHKLAQLAVRLLGVEQEGILALLGELGIVAEEGPVAALDGELLLLDALAHALDHAVVDAGGVSDDDGGAFVRRGFLEALPRSFFGVTLPAAANCALAPTGVALEAWPPVLE